MKSLVSNRSRSDTSLFVFLLICLVWVPLPLGSNRPWAMHLFELMSFGALLRWVWLYQSAKVDTSVVYQKSRVVIVSLGLFALAQALQLIPLPLQWVAKLRQVDPLLESAQWLTLSIDRFETWVHLRLTLAFMVFVFLLFNLVTSKKRVKWLLATLLASGVFQALYGSLMTLSGFEYGFFIKKDSYLGVATGTFVNRNHLANYLILCLSAGTALLLADLYQTSAKNWRERGQRIMEAILGEKFRVRIGLAMMVIALVLTRSRMGNTAFFFSLVATGFLWLLLTKRATRGAILLLVSLIVIDTLIVGAWFGIDEVKQRIEGSAFDKETRDEVNRDTWAMVQQQPLFGSGAGSYYTAFPRYKQDDINLYYNHAHNDYLQFLAEYGVVGCLPLLALGALGFYQSMRAMRRRKTLLFQALAFAPFMSIMAMLIHSVVEFNLQIPGNALTFLCVLCMAWIARYLPSSEVGARLSRHRA